MSIFNKKAINEIKENEYDLKLKELSNKIASVKAELLNVIQELKKIDTIKKSFIMDTEFSTTVNSDYNIYLKYFKTVVENLTNAINKYNEYYSQNYDNFIYCKNYRLEYENSIYNFIKASILL